MSNKRKIISICIVIAIIISMLLSFQTVKLSLSVPVNQKDASSQENKLVIYTYDSLLKWGENYTEVYDKVFGEFERRYNVTIELVEFSSARNALLRLVEEKDNPKADIIIGIDNILAIEAIKEDILLQYTPENLTYIKPELIDALDPTHHVIPFDYGLIALVYDTKYINETTYPEISHLTFEDLTDPKFSGTLIVEDPTQSSTGLSFLLWQIAIYSKLLNKDWKEWWTTVKDNIKVTKSWGDAYDIFLEESAGRHIVVSYGTDGAYSYYFYNSTRYNATLVYYNGKPYGWLQVEGIGIVKNAPHEDLAKNFTEWFLSVEVQQHIPLNNWMYPANKNVTLPEAYKYAINPDDVEIANLLLNQTEIEECLHDWLYDWTELMVTGEEPTEGPDTTIYMIAGAIIGIAFAVLVVIVLKRKRII